MSCPQSTPATPDGAAAEAVWWRAALWRARRSATAARRASASAASSAASRRSSSVSTFTSLQPPAPHLTSYADCTARPSVCTTKALGCTAHSVLCSLQHTWRHQAFRVHFSGAWPLPWRPFRAHQRPPRRHRHRRTAEPRFSSDAWQVGPQLPPPRQPCTPKDTAVHH